MLIADDTICKFCKAVFCCAECRHKHEIKNHAIVVRKSIMIPPEDIKNNAANNTNGENSSYDITYCFCPICENQPLILKREMHDEVILHIELHHLPLRCQKCFKTYNKIKDLKKFSKCMLPNRISLTSNQTCCTDEASKITVTKADIPQSSPLTRQDFNESHMTPISIINMRWKAKSKLANDEFISDSVSSIKNLSSISNSSARRSIEKCTTVKGKVIRCSSTPVQLEMVLSKPKEQTTFNATGPHISSISGCESDTSPALSQPNNQALEAANRYMKLAGSRPRMSAVTPLRQAISKSIQKAFAEHGLPGAHSVKNLNDFQRKNIFDSTSSPYVNDEQSSVQTPLDLRLSPAVRRSQSESKEYLNNGVLNKKTESNELLNMRREILLSSQKLTTESIVITRTEHLSSVSSSTSSVNSCPITKKSYQSTVPNNTSSALFKSCSSVEIITATAEEIQQYDGENLGKSVVPPLTPITSIPGSFIHKKNIKFETPKVELCDPCNIENSPNDLFFTPNATPIPNNSETDSAEEKRKLLAKQNLSGRFSRQRTPSVKECANSTAYSRVENIENNFDNINEIGDEDDEVFSNQESKIKSQKLNGLKAEHKTQQSGGLWSLMTSVMRLPSFSGINSKESHKIDQPYSSAVSKPNSLIKRCASIAGSLVRPKSLADENMVPLKRKRTYTIDNHSSLSYFGELNNKSDIDASSKRFRIQGRRPIDRMRLNS